MRRYFRLLLLVSLLWVGGAYPMPARAQAPSAQSVIEAVNALRLTRGLAPYTIDPWLMAYAQEHSDYQASIGYSTHTHSDGSTSWASGIEENVASGSVDFITINFIVYQVWADAVHMKPMVGFASGKVGVGMAVSGDTAFYTLNVIPTGTLVSQTSVEAEDSAVVAVAPASGTETLVTSTPLPDGAVYHVVQSGQTLWSIAVTYGVTVQRIRDLNNLLADSTDIYVNQKLLIILPGTPYYTATPTATQTPLVTETPVPTMTLTPAPSHTPTRTAAATSTSVVPSATLVTQRLAVEAPPATGSTWGDILGVVLLVLAGFSLGMWVGQRRATRKAAIH